MKSISHPERLSLVECLEEGSATVGKMGKCLGMEQAVVSKHLGILKRCGVVKSEAKGNFRYYSLGDREVLKILNCVLRKCNSWKGERK